MITLEPNMSHSDIHQWLNRGWFLFKPTQVDEHFVPARIVNYPSEMKTSVYVIRDINETLYELKYPALFNQVYPHWPNCGAINLEDYKVAGFLQRRQRRQWRRTYNSQCIELVIPRRWDAFSAQPALRHVNSNSVITVKEAFEPTYIKLNELQTHFKSGWLSVALAPQIIVTNTTPFLVYYKNRIAGKLIDNTYLSVNPTSSKRVRKIIPEWF